MKAGQGLPVSIYSFWNSHRIEVKGPLSKRNAIFRLTSQLIFCSPAVYACLRTPFLEKFAWPKSVKKNRMTPPTTTVRKYRDLAGPAPQARARFRWWTSCWKRWSTWPRTLRRNAVTVCVALFDNTSGLVACKITRSMLRHVSEAYSAYTSIPVFSGTILFLWSTALFWLVKSLLQYVTNPFWLNRHYGSEHPVSICSHPYFHWPTHCFCWLAFWQIHMLTGGFTSKQLTDCRPTSSHILTFRLVDIPISTAWAARLISCLRGAPIATSRDLLFIVILRPSQGSTSDGLLPLGELWPMPYEINI